jgi:lipopolysaccharide transport system permease protein
MSRLISIKQRLWLVSELTKRDLAQRYRGTLLGLIWPVLYAALYLAVLTFVFAIVLRIRWGQYDASQPVGAGALMILSGLVPYLFIAEVMGRSTDVINSAQNLVKRVRFPLHLLPLVSVNSALALGIINSALLVAVGLALGYARPSAIILLPLVWLPLFVLAVGVAWMLSAVAVFFRDLAQVTPVVVQLMMFMAPVFYPQSMIPDEFQFLVELNPLTYFVDAFRGAMAGYLEWVGWLRSLVFQCCFAAFSYLVFRRLKPAFADSL